MPEAPMPFEISKNLLGKRTVAYSCPQCKDSLTSYLEGAGKQDSCPTCNFVFTVPDIEKKEEFARAKREKREEKKRQENQWLQCNDCYAREKYDAEIHGELNRETYVCEDCIAEQEKTRNRLEKQREKSDLSWQEANRLRNLDAQRNEDQATKSNLFRTITLVNTLNGFALLNIVLVIVYAMYLISAFRNEEHPELAIALVASVVISGGLASLLLFVLAQALALIFDIRSVLYQVRERLPERDQKEK